MVNVAFVQSSPTVCTEGKYEARWFILRANCITWDTLLHPPTLAAVNIQSSMVDTPLSQNISFLKKPRNFVVEFSSWWQYWFDLRVTMIFLSLSRPHIHPVVFPPAIVSIPIYPPFTRFISSHNYSTTTPHCPADCRCAPPEGFMVVGGLAVQSSTESDWLGPVDLPHGRGDV